MRKSILYLLVPIITLILELLPYGAVLNFANPEGEPWRETFSYFDLTPFGYANFAPFITAIMTCIILFLLLVYCVTGKEKMIITARNILYAGAVISVGPLMFGVRYLSIVGVMITISIVTEIIILHLHIKNTVIEE